MLLGMQGKARMRCACCAWQETTSGAWHQGQLYVATPSAVHCIFVVPNPHNSAPRLEA